MALDVGHTRVLLFEHLGTSISSPFLVVLVFWLCTIFGSFGLFAPETQRDRCPLRLRAVGFRCDLSYPGARPVVRGTAAGLWRPAAHGPGPGAGAVRT